MKIKRIRTYHLRMELTPAEAFAFSQARVTARTAMLVEIVADDGRSGWGEAYGPPAQSRTIIDELYAPRLIDRDLMDTAVDQLAVEPLKRVGAMIGAPERPGLGLEVDRAVLDRYAVTTGESKR